MSLHIIWVNVFLRACLYVNAYVMFVGGHVCFGACYVWVCLSLFIYDLSYLSTMNNVIQNSVLSVRSTLTLPTLLKFTGRLSPNVLMRLWRLWKQQQLSTLVPAPRSLWNLIKQWNLKPSISLKFTYTYKLKMNYLVFFFNFD